MASRNNFGSEYTQRYGSGRDDRDESSGNTTSRGSQRENASHQEALGDYNSGRNSSSGREHGYRDPSNERQDQTFNRHEGSHEGQQASRYASGDYRSSPYENENRGSSTGHARQDGMHNPS
ncbi:MAG: hypothetical protein H7Z43_01725, partial [Clostridia bacterium]|nr:hypothetical protein [Deltaproteobacteria bacterium]